MGTDMVPISPLRVVMLTGTSSIVDWHFWLQRFRAKLRERWYDDGFQRADLPCGSSVEHLREDEGKT
jgi:hypothetical protein